MLFVSLKGPLARRTSPLVIWFCRSFGLEVQAKPLYELAVRKGRSSMKIPSTTKFENRWRDSKEFFPRQESNKSFRIRSSIRLPKNLRRNQSRLAIHSAVASWQLTQLAARWINMGTSLIKRKPAPDRSMRGCTLPTLQSFQRRSA